MLDIQNECQRGNIPLQLHTARLMKLCELFNNAEFCRKNSLQWANLGSCEFNYFSTLDNLVEIEYVIKIKKGNSFF